MATIKVCDVCFKKNKFIKSRYRVGYAHGIKIDLCKEHKNWAKDKTNNEFENSAVKLLLGYS